MIRHAIYVPGLGDYRKYAQPIVLLWWRLFGVKAHFFPLGWQSNESFNKKLERLIAGVDEMEMKYGSVSLVGVSAGASAVLNAFASREGVKNVVCICGKINNPQTVGEQVYKNNPPFKESVDTLQRNLHKINAAERKRIMSIHPIEDRTVPPEDTIIKGAVELTVPTKGHIFSIYYSVMFKAPTICKFLRGI